MKENEIVQEIGTRDFSLSVLSCGLLQYGSWFKDKQEKKRVLGSNGIRGDFDHECSCDGALNPNP